MADPSQTAPEGKSEEPRPASAPAQVQVTVSQSPAPAQAVPRERAEAKPQEPKPQSSAAVLAEKARPAHEGPVTEAMPEHVAAAVSYLFGWISGLVFLLVDRRPYVRYHAAQSVVIFATLSVVLLVLGGFFLGTFLPGIGGLLLILRRIVELIWLVAAVVLILKAASGERYRVPYAASYADRAAGTR
ncbi:MAG TPA: DUF4870 domain-containing protein [Polyangiaceae bacterium]|jgi:uncharacterized membrane protein